MQNIDQHFDIAACERLAVACYSLMDRGYYEQSAALFTDDARWLRGVKWVETRHLVTNLLVTITGPDDAEAIAGLIAMRANRSETGPAETPGPIVVGDLVYRFRRGPEGWKISFLEPIPIYVPPAPRT
jgi:hypothetical protein